MQSSMGKMMFIDISRIAILATFIAALSPLASQAADRPTPERAHRATPQTRVTDTPANYLRTPFGLVDPSCYIRLPSGAQIVKEQIYYPKTDKYEDIPSCTKPRYTDYGRIIDNSTSLLSLMDTTIVRSVTDGPPLTRSPYNFFSTNVLIEGALPTPTLGANQTLFLITGGAINYQYTLNPSGLYSVLGWNMPFHEGVWATASMIPNIKNNVIFISTKTTTGQNFTYIGSSYGASYRDALTASLYATSNGTNKGSLGQMVFDAPAILHEAVLAGVKIYGDSPCDGMTTIPLSVTAALMDPNVFRTYPDTKKYITNPNNVSNSPASCNVHINIRPATNTNSVNMDLVFGAQPAPVSRSAVITFKDN